jgi:predicted XRE-type DNA-binding protein
MTDIDIELSSGSVYTDLGHPEDTDMQLKASLTIRISDILADRSLTQIQAARILGIPQPKLSRILRGQFRGISASKLLACLNRLGQDVDIVVHEATDGATGLGQTRVTG